jgi:amino acid adenylation domain-containing protein
LAAELRRRGAGRGTIVGVDLDRSVGLVVTLLGIVRAGAAYLPLDDQAPPERVAAILEEAGADLVIVSSDAAAARPDGRLPAHVQRLAEPRGLPNADDDMYQGPESAPDDPAYVAYTSGSTGRPKGVVVPHRAVLRLVDEPLFCTLAVGERVANASNPTFDATTFEVWNTLTAGATIVVFPSVSDLTIERWAELVRSESIDTMFVTTSLFHMVARERPDAFRELHTVIAGGEQMDLAATRRVLAAGPPKRLVNGYGPTETTTFAAYYDCTDASLADRDAIPIGYALQNTRLHVFDEDLRPVPPGEPGELYVGGPGVALGYLHRPDLTSLRFVPEPGQPPGTVMYRTGDLVERGPDGELTLLGRRDRQVKLRGFRIELEEIERAVLATGRAAGVIAEKIGDGPSAYLVAFVEAPAKFGDADLSTLIVTDLTTRLPSYMIPTRWLILPDFPIGPTGKVDRAGLLSRISAVSAKEVAIIGDDGLTSAVRAIWSAVLDTPFFEPTDDFIAAGGNSILAMQVASRISEQLNVPVDPADVLLASSFEEFAAQVAWVPNIVRSAPRKEDF